MLTAPPEDIEDLDGWMLASGLIRLALDENGNAHGRFLVGGDTVSHTLTRHERPHPLPPLRRHPHHPHLSQPPRQPHGPLRRPARRPLCRARFRTLATGDRPGGAVRAFGRGGAPI
ncbi:hypothetical protein ACWGJZ_19985, partial [Streptomyces rimosus]